MPGVIGGSTISSAQTVERTGVRGLQRLLIGLMLFGRALGRPLARIALALPFLRSGLTRWDGFLSLSPATQFLFEQQFKLHAFGREFALPFPDQLGFLVGIAELVLPILLIIGLGTRLSAAGLLIMTSVIQLVFPDGWRNFHLYWAALALAIMALGPGALSVDFCIQRFVPQRCASKPQVAPN